MDNNISTYYDGKYNRYVGARYVPVFANPVEWDSSKTYDPLTIVTYQGNSYTSKTFVPTGVEITDNTYWAATGNYNAQVEAYRQEVLKLSEDIDALSKKYGEVLTASSIKTSQTPAADINNMIQNGKCDTLFIDDDITLETYITPKNGMRIIGEGGTITCNVSPIYSNEPLSSAITTTTSEVVENTTSINVANPNVLTVGDEILLIGSENLFNNDDINVTMGVGTGADDTVYTMFVTTVINIVGNTVTISTPAPYYCGICSIFKPNFLENVIIDNVNFNLTGSGITLYNCRNVIISNCNIESNGTYMIYIGMSYDCTIENNTIRYTNPAEISSVLRTNIEVASSARCVVKNNHLSNGYHAIDLSYLSGYYTCRDCIVDGNICDSMSNTITTHPATIRINIVNNNVVANGNFNGIYVRGRLHKIDNNIVRGLGSLSNGIQVGWFPIDGVTITNNEIYNCNFGVAIYYSSAHPSIAVSNEQADSVIISGNSIYAVNNGLAVVLPSGQDTYCNITFSGNTIKGLYDADDYGSLFSFSGQKLIGTIIISNNNCTQFGNTHIFGTPLTTIEGVSVSNNNFENLFAVARGTGDKQTTLTGTIWGNAGITQTASLNTQLFGLVEATPV